MFVKYNVQETRFEVREPNEIISWESVWYNLLSIIQKKHITQLLLET
jgi:hypothetical protein